MKGQLYIALINIFLFLKSLNGYIIDIMSNSDNLSSNMYLCDNLSITYNYNQASSFQTLFQLIKFKPNFSGYDLAISKTLSINYPTNALIQADGEDQCSLYFVQKNQKQQVKAYYLRFNDLTLLESDVQAIPTQYTGNYELLTEDDQDFDQHQQTRLFFLKNTNLYFTESKGKVQWQSNLSFNLKQAGITAVNRSILVSLNTITKEQALYTFNLIENILNIIQIPLTLSQPIYGNIGQIVVPNILEIENYLKLQPFVISLYEKNTYWILQVNTNNPQQLKVLYKLPNNYSLIRNYNQPYTQTPKCINYFYRSNIKTNNDTYSILCPTYAFLSNYTSNNNYAFSTIIHNNNLDILIENIGDTQLSQPILLSIYKNQTGQLVKYQEDSTKCKDIPNVIQLKKQKQLIISCKQTESTYYTLNISYESIRIDASNMKLWEIVVYVVFTLIVMWTVSRYLYMRRKIKHIAIQFARLEYDNKIFELNEQQFKEKYLFLDKPLGKGTFGVVSVCQEQPNKIALTYNKNLKSVERAVKTIHMDKDQQGQELEEVMLLRQLQKYHNVIRLINYHKYKNTLFIIMELAKFNLEEEIEQRIKNDKKHYTKKEILQFCQQIGFLIRDLHMGAVTHRDLKPQNILVVEDKEYRLSDFGAARALKLEDFYRQNTQVGSLKWMSPEMYISCYEGAVGMYKLNYFKCDVFSFGLILLRMITLRDIKNVNNLQSTKNRMIEQMRKERQDVGEELINVISEMLEYDIKQRIEMQVFKKKIEQIIKEEEDQTGTINQLQRSLQIIKEENDLSIIGDCQNDDSINNTTKPQKYKNNSQKEPYVVSSRQHSVNNTFDPKRNNASDDETISSGLNNGFNSNNTDQITFTYQRLNV